MNSAISMIGRTTNGSNSHMKVYPRTYPICGTKLDLGPLAPYISILNLRYKAR